MTRGDKCCGKNAAEGGVEAVPGQLEWLNLQFEKTFLIK